LTFTFHPFARPALRGRCLPFLACGVISPTQSSTSNIRWIGQGVRGLRLPKIRGFPLTLNVALTTVLRTNVLHCDINKMLYNSLTGHWYVVSHLQLVGITSLGDVANYQ